VFADAALNPAPRRHVTNRWSRALCLFAPLALVVHAAAADPIERAPDASISSGGLVATVSPLLAGWIASSREAALAQGVEKIPESIRAAFEGYVPDATLARVRWRAGGAADMSLQQGAFAFGEAQAVTLDYVIVFADEDAARHDPKLWAHELRHVMQFEQWGVAGFAQRYIADHSAVEDEASEFRWQYMKLKGLVPPPSVPSVP
jgi:hypothetical protein